MREYIVEILNGAEGFISRVRDVVTGEYEKKIKECKYVDSELESYELELRASLKGDNIKSFRHYKRTKHMI